MLNALGCYKNAMLPGASARTPLGRSSLQRSPQTQYLLSVVMVLVKQVFYFSS